uniref:Small ribosomal subunit protein mS29 n=1 Tax=Eptatretus burgeri TaxID=7764 RepID=A0A8C4N7U6_EPTBU
MHLGMYYTVPPEVEAFNEACIMIREPALELISYLSSANYSLPAARYLIYGKKGSGKSITLNHIVHYCATQGWLTVHVPDAHLWVKNCRDLLPSTYRQGRYDQPTQAVNWLRKFRISNEKFLKEVTLMLHSHFYPTRHLTFSFFTSFLKKQSRAHPPKVEADCESKWSRPKFICLLIPPIVAVSPCGHCLTLLTQAFQMCCPSLPHVLPLWTSTISSTHADYFPFRSYLDHCYSFLCYSCYLLQAPLPTPNIPPG